VVAVASAAATEIDITLPKSANILSHKQPLMKSTTSQMLVTSNYKNKHLSAFSYIACLLQKE